MKVSVEFHFDFGSPNAYLAHQVVPEIAKRTGVPFQYVPVLLGGVFKATGNVSPAVSNAGIKNKGEYGALEIRRFLRKHHVARFAMNPYFPVNTLAIMRGAVAAEMLGVAPRYIEAMFAGMWEDGLKLDDPAVIVATLNKAGLDGAKLAALTQDQAVKDKLLANTTASVERGTFGAPTYFVGKEMFFGKDRLRDVEEEIVARKAG